MVGVIIVYALVALVVPYWIAIRLWYRRWGVTDAELNQPMPGDGEVSAPNYVEMLAVTIDAPVEYVWPWLMQMGKGRAVGCTATTGSVDRLVTWIVRAPIASCLNISIWPSVT